MEEETSYLGDGHRVRHQVPNEVQGGIPVSGGGLSGDFELGNLSLEAFDLLLTHCGVLALLAEGPDLLGSLVHLHLGGFHLADGGTPGEVQLDDLIDLLRRGKATTLGLADELGVAALLCGCSSGRRG